MVTSTEVFLEIMKELKERREGIAKESEVESSEISGGGSVIG
jgi:hypothetical protein